MALVAWVMKVLPLKLVFWRNQGRAPQWSRWKLKWEHIKPAIIIDLNCRFCAGKMWKCKGDRAVEPHWLISSRSISAGSIKSMYGRASIPSNPGWMPQSSCHTQIQLCSFKSNLHQCCFRTWNTTMAIICQNIWNNKINLIVLNAWKQKQKIALCTPSNR